MMAGSSASYWADVFRYRAEKINQYLIDKPSLIALGSAAVLVYLICILGYTGRDDSHITYFVSDQIAQGNGIVNYSGQRIEQSSSLLYTAALAAIGYLTDLNAADTGPAFSLLCYLGFIAQICYLAKKGSSPYWVGLVAGTAVPGVYWALSGMENSFYLLLLSGFLTTQVAVGDHCLRHLMFVVIAAAISLTRPEGSIVIGSSAVGIMVLNRAAGYKADFSLGICVALGVFLALVVRVYWLDLGLFPNTVYAKQNITLVQRFSSGLAYIRYSAKSHTYLSLLSAAGFLFLLVRLFTGLDRNRFLIVSGSLSLAFAVAGFSFLSGGDWMENARFLVPTYAFLAFATVLAVERKYRPPMAVLFLIIALVEGAQTATQAYGGYPVPYHRDYRPLNFKPSKWEAYNRIHARDLSFIDQFLAELKENKKEHIVIGSVQAGIVLYYLQKYADKRITFVDLVGLASNEVQDCSEWGENIYRSWRRINECIDKPFDYIFDLKHPAYAKIPAFESSGCRLLLRDSVQLDSPAWKAPLRQEQFLMKCIED